MTWIRWETSTPQSDVVGELAARLKIGLAQALGHYNAACCGFGDHRQDGKVAEVSDDLLEQWALWKGKPGLFAKAFRDRCADPDGVLRGWWRQAKLLAKAEKDRTKRKPAKNPQKTPEGSSREKEETPGPTYERTNERTNEPTPPTREATGSFAALLARLPVTGGVRWVITEFLESRDQPDGWVGCFTMMLEGFGMPEGKPATPEAIAVVCQDMGTKPAHDVTPKFFRACVAAHLRSNLPRAPLRLGDSPASEEELGRSLLAEAEARQRDRVVA